MLKITLAPPVTHPMISVARLSGAYPPYENHDPPHGSPLFRTYHDGVATPPSWFLLLRFLPTDVRGGG